VGKQSELDRQPVARAMMESLARKVRIAIHASGEGLQVEDVEDHNDLGYHEEFQGLYVMSHRRQDHKVTE